MTPLPPSHRKLLRQKSKIDKSVDAVKSLNQGIKRVALGTSVLNEAYDELLDGLKNGMTKTEERKLTKKIRLSIDNFEQVVQPMSASLNLVAPLPNLSYGIQRLNTAERRERQMLSDLTNHGRVNVQSESAAVIELQKFVGDTAPQIRKLLRRDAKSKNSKKLPPVAVAVELPTPEKGEAYTPAEACKILKGMKGRTRGAAIRMMIEMKRVLCGQKQLYALTKKHESQLKPWWNMEGRPAIVNSKALADQVQTHQGNNVGMSLGRKAV
jgi:hypothetical protein